MKSRRASELRRWATCVDSSFAKKHTRTVVCAGSGRECRRNIILSQRLSVIAHFLKRPSVALVDIHAKFAGCIQFQPYSSTVFSECTAAS